MRGPRRVFAALALTTMIGLLGLQPARAGGPGGFGPSGRPRGFDNGFRPGFPYRDGGFRNDFNQRRNPRFCWCGFDFYRNPGHHHHHDRFDRFDRFPQFPNRGNF